MYKLKHIKSGEYFHNFGRCYIGSPYSENRIIAYCVMRGINGTLYHSLKKAEEILAKIDSILQPEEYRAFSKDFVIVEFSPAFEIGPIKDLTESKC